MPGPMAGPSYRCALATPVVVDDEVAAVLIVREPRPAGSTQTTRADADARRAGRSGAAGSAAARRIAAAGRRLAITLEVARAVVGTGDRGVALRSAAPRSAAMRSNAVARLTALPETANSYA